MKTSQSLSQYYKTIETLTDAHHARESVMTVMNMVMREIQEQGLEMTPEIMDQKITHYVGLYLNAVKSKKTAA